MLLLLRHIVHSSDGSRTWNVVFYIILALAAYLRRSRLSGINTENSTYSYSRKLFIFCDLDCLLAFQLWTKSWRDYCNDTLTILQKILAKIDTMTTASILSPPSSFRIFSVVILSIFARIFCRIGWSTIIPWCTPLNSFGCGGTFWIYGSLNILIDIPI